MRKKLIEEHHSTQAASERHWLDLELLAEVELTSEDADYPIEAALLPAGKSGWRAATPGRQTIRLLFAEPQQLKHIQLDFAEPVAERTQEYALRCSSDRGVTFREIVRQQWNFSPSGATTETESYEVELAHVTDLELTINPDIGNSNAVASMEQWRVA